MTKPRNPRYFPRMKVRGARRRKLAIAQRIVRSFDRFGVAVEFAAWQLNLIATLYTNYPARRATGADQAVTDE